MITLETLALCKRRNEDLAASASAAAALKAFEDGCVRQRRAEDLERRKLQEAIGSADARVQESNRGVQEIWREVAAEVRQAASNAGIELRELEHHRSAMLGNELSTRDFVKRVEQASPPQPSVLDEAKARHERDKAALVAHDRKIAAAKLALSRAKAAEQKAFEDARKSAADRLEKETKARAR